MASKAITEKALTMLNYLKENSGENLTNADIAEDLGISPRSVVGSVNGLVKREFAERVEASIEITNEDGSTGTKPVKFIKITKAGMDYDHDAALAQDAAAKAE